MSKYYTKTMEDGQPLISVTDEARKELHRRIDEVLNMPHLRGIVINIVGLPNENCEYSE